MLNKDLVIELDAVDEMVRVYGVRIQGINL